MEQRTSCYRRYCRLSLGGILMDVILKPVHVGDILYDEFMQPYHITAYRLAQMTGLSQTQIGRIIKGKRGITVDTALRFAQVFSTSPEFWLNIQNRYEIDSMKAETKETIKQIQPIKDIPLNAATEQSLNFGSCCINAQQRIRQ